MSDLYAVLGITDTRCSDNEIKRAYRQKVAQWHPDKHGDSQEATEKFQRIQHAYDVLGDAKRRSLHDLGMLDEDPTSPSSSAFGGNLGKGFKSSGDARVDLVATATSLGELVVHNIKHGAIKNSLVVVLVVTAVVTAGWWGWVLALLAAASMAWSMRGWFKILAKSPIVTPGSARGRE